MIVSFGDADTKLLWETGRSRRIPANLRRVALRKLMILNAALELNNLRVPPNNRLEELTQDRKRSTLYPRQRSIPNLFQFGTQEMRLKWKS